MAKARAIALYLPQFHPIPENDEWWGKGFTEWTNTAKAKPLFRGHYQPHVPADLGFYDLRVAETRAQQAEMARAYGIEGFCYYHYWFGGKRILHRPLDEVIASGQPDFPFCVCWANETWTGIWHGAPNRTLIEQTYPGVADHEAHFATLLPAFRDPRYIRVDGKPIFVIFRPRQIPDAAATLDLWRNMAKEAGLGGLHFVGVTDEGKPLPDELGFDASQVVPHINERRWPQDWKRPIARLKMSINHRRGIPHVYHFSELVERSMPRRTPGMNYPTVCHAWDNSPRSGQRAVVYTDPDPKYYRELLRGALDAVAHHDPEHRIVFLKSWNEWAEGNHLEPDLRYGLGYLEAVREVIGLSS